jgi:hypothetical protein
LQSSSVLGDANRTASRNLLLEALRNGVGSLSKLIG